MKWSGVVGLCGLVGGLATGGVARAQQVSPNVRCVPIGEAQRQGAAAPTTPPPAAAAPCPTNVCAAARVHFAFNSDELSQEDKAALDSSADCLKSNKEVNVMISGGTDDRGSDKYNLELGQRRAKAVSDYLSSQGVSEDQLRVASIGKGEPLCDTTTEDCNARNRRVTILPTAPVAP